MYDAWMEEFGGKKVVTYEKAESWVGPDVAYAVREDYEDETSISQRLDSLVANEGATALQAIVIGAWGKVCEGDDSGTIIETLAGFAPRLPELRALFLGDMTYSECELSWINQGDVTPLLRAFPNLREFGVRGGSGLRLSRIDHPHLVSLTIETGGLSRETIRDIFLCQFPALEKLVLLLGESNYGFDGGVEDLQPLMTGKLFPNLKHLGLMNSEIANDIAAVIVNAPVVERLEVLDLSMGNLSSEGVRSLMSLAEQKTLKRLNISHHYASPEEIETLKKALPFELVAAPASDDGDEEDEDWRPILHAE